MARPAMLASMIVLVALMLCAPQVAYSWYVPGVSPYNYKEGESVAIKVNSLTSVEGILPFGFYSVKTCQPTKDEITRLRRKENLGEILSGEQIEPSLYFAEMKVNSQCRKMCDQLTLTDDEMKTLEKRIDQLYKGNLVLDNLPVAQELPGNNPLAPKVMTGYPLGVPKRLTQEKKTVINNHLQFVIGYHEPELQPDPTITGYRIVYFYVRPQSIDWTDANKECTAQSPVKVENFKPLTTSSQKITYTYSVEWKEEPNIVWATRWDSYMSGGAGEGRIHWMSIVNSLIIVTLLSSLVAVIILRALRKDITKYNELESGDKADETGWKLVHAEVFRCPPNATSLITQIASGCQLLAMSGIVLCFACLGLLSPSNRGGLVTWGILIFALLGCFAGYVAARFFKSLGLRSWKRIFVVGLAFPGVMLGIYLMLNFVTWAENASSAIPFSTLCLIVALWLLVSLSLTVVGASYGYQQETFKLPCKVSAVPREIPPIVWYLRPEIAIPWGGTLPFGAAFIELLFIFSSLWQGRIYYVFGFLAMVFVIVVITCAEVSIVYTYFQLIAEEYRWWHRSYYITGVSGIHMFLYGAYYFHTAMTQVQAFSSMILYFGYTAMMSICFGLLTGAVGFLASFFFIRAIYGAVKVD